MIVKKAIYDVKAGLKRVAEIELTEEEIEEKNRLQQKFESRQKLNELTTWFSNYFDKQLIQSSWQSDFKVSHDEYFNKDYMTLDELKEKANVVRAEIIKLRKMLLK